MTDNGTVSVHRSIMPLEMQKNCEGHISTRIFFGCCSSFSDYVREKQKKTKVFVFTESSIKE
jgi:hypothetical protein